MINILKLLIGPYRKIYFRILGLFLFKYIPAGYSSVSAVNIASDIDYKIPERAVVTEYMDLFYFPIVILARAGSARKNNLKLKEDITRASQVLEKIYQHNYIIYKNSQSTFIRKPTKNISVKILHFFDRNRNCYPSLHAQILTEMFNVLSDHPEVISKDELAKRTVVILESCFLTKQHSLADIGAGFAGVTIIDPSFSEEKAQDLISQIFLDRDYGMSTELRNNIRNNILFLYQKLVNESHTKSYSEVLSPRNRVTDIHGQTHI